MNNKSNIVTDTPVDFSKLKKFFENDPNVFCSILFGSSQSGSIKQGSDLDIGVLFESPPENSLKEFDYYSKLCNYIDFADVVDMVVMNNVDEILNFEILNGKFICKNSPEKTAEFASYISRMHEDTMITQGRYN